MPQHAYIFILFTKNVFFTGDYTLYTYNLRIYYKTKLYLFLLYFQFYYVTDVLLCCRIEQFSLECRKTKTKVITLANHKGRRAIHCPIKT